MVKLDNNDDIDINDGQWTNLDEKNLLELSAQVSGNVLEQNNS